MIITDLHPVLFPENIPYGLQKTVLFNDDVQNSSSGKDAVYSIWDKAKREYNLKYNLLNNIDYLQLKSFYLNRFGETYRFLYNDFMDNTLGEDSTDLSYLCLVSNVVMPDTQIQKRYVDNAGFCFNRDITRVKISSIRIFRDDIGYIPTSAYNIDSFCNANPKVLLTTTKAPIVPINLMLWRNGNWSNMQMIETDSGHGKDPIIESSWPPASQTYYSVFDQISDNYELIIGDGVTNDVYLTFKVSNAISSGMKVDVQIIYEHVNSGGVTKPGEHLHNSRVVDGQKYFYSIADSLLPQGIFEGDYYWYFYKLCLPVNDFWDGDAFCFRVIAYTGTDSSVESNLVWEEYSTWFRFAKSSVSLFSDISDTGIIKFDPSYQFSVGCTLWVSGSFYVPVRFASDSQNITYIEYNNIDWNNLKLVESGI